MSIFSANSISIIPLLQYLKALLSRFRIIFSLARLCQRKHYYFVPYGQDDPFAKPQSLKADLALLPAAVDAGETIGMRIGPNEIHIMARSEG